MKKEQLTMFDLEAAFKALDEIDIPKAEKGIRANKEDLKESFKDYRRSRTDLLMEDYYDISDTADLEEAKAEREAEVAKAKLARIEKIVDLEAESEEDLLPSYIGKMIIQCPQCMTLFYKDEADIVKSETDEETVNVAEACQHCGNDAGYTVIGKVEGVQEEEFTQEDEVIENESEGVEDLSEVEEENSTEVEEASDLEASEAEEVENEENLEELPEIELEGDADEEVKESLDKTLTETYWACAIVDGEERRYPFGTREEARQYISMIQNGEAKEFEGKKITSTWTESLREDVDKDLNDKLEAHNEYIEYLQEEISKEEKALEEAKNDFIKEAIQRRIDALKEDLEKALPEEVKNTVEAEAEAPVEVEEPVESDVEVTEESEEKAEEAVEEVEESEESEEVEDISAPEAEEVVKEALTEELLVEEEIKDLSEDEFEELVDYLGKNESIETDVDILKDVEEIDEKQLAESIYHNLKESVQGLKAIKILNCKLNDNILIIEGKMRVDDKIEELVYTCEDMNVSKDTFNATGLVESLKHNSKVNLAGIIKNNILSINKINNI